MFINANNGFNLNSNFSSVESNKYMYFNPNINTLSIMDVNFRFFIDSKIQIKTCNDMIDFNLMYPISVFQANVFGILNLFIYYPIFKSDICPMVFRNSIINSLSFSGLMDSFYRTNVLRFAPIFQDYDINSNVFQLSIQQTMNIVLDSRILEKHVFKRIVILNLFSDIRAIQVDLFVPFDQLIEIKINNFNRITRRQGIKWLTYLNRDLNVNLSNSDELNRFVFRRLYIINFIICI